MVESLYYTPLCHCNVSIEVNFVITTIEKWTHSLSLWQQLTISTVVDSAHFSQHTSKLQPASKCASTHTLTHSDCRHHYPGRSIDRFFFEDWSLPVLRQNFFPFVLTAIHVSSTSSTHTHILSSSTFAVCLWILAHASWKRGDSSAVVWRICPQKVPICSRRLGLVAKTALPQQPTLMITKQLMKLCWCWWERKTLPSEEQL